MARVDYTAKGVSADQIKRVDGSDGRDNAKAFAARRDGIDVSAVQEGVNIGSLEPAGVDGADSFVGYTPIHKIRCKFLFIRIFNLIINNCTPRMNRFNNSIFEITSEDKRTI